MTFQGLFGQCDVSLGGADGTFESLSNIAVIDTLFNGNVTGGGWNNGNGTVDSWNFPRPVNSFGAAGIPESNQGGIFAGAGTFERGPESFFTELSDLVIGQEYTISFEQANAGVSFRNTETAFGDTARWQVQFGTEFQLSPRLPYLGIGNQVWSYVSMTFTANNTEEILMFTFDNDGMTTHFYEYMAIDNIRVATMIPEDPAISNTLFICNNDSSAINLYDVLVGETLGGFWIRESGTGGLFNAALGTFIPTLNATTSVFRYTVCDVSTSFATINIGDSSVDAPLDVKACESYILPPLLRGSYFDAPDGSGNSLNEGDVITTSTRLYVYGVNNLVPGCSSENSFLITIYSPPVINNLLDLRECFDEENNSTSFDFSSVEEFINSIDPSFNVAGYYNTMIDAENNTNVIENPTDYSTNEEREKIYVRVLNGSCYTVTDFDIVKLSVPLSIEGLEVLCLDKNGTLLPNQDNTLYTLLDPNLYSFKWTLNGLALEVTEPYIFIDKPGTYSVIVESLTNGCVTRTSKDVKSSAGPSSFLVNVEPGSFADVFSIKAFAVGISEYEFSLDGGLFQNNGDFTTNISGYHFVTIRDIYGCSEEVVELCLLDYQRFFTPNGDGVNDTWKILGSQCGTIVKLTIYNRYGQLLTEVNLEGRGWDGYYQGSSLPSDDYWFKVNYIENETEKVFKGHFALKR
ncbi:T9SS type B sorting domain-containing protein [Croceitalea marina]|uniref:T9SS type B sorting domain-containing protein n=1 Tax=Croceitalea marina TaxID=1775166 RepID=A0ABW5MWD6_9FLAO